MHELDVEFYLLKFLMYYCLLFSGSRKQCWIEHFLWFIEKSYVLVHDRAMIIVEKLGPENLIEGEKLSQLQQVRHTKDKSVLYLARVFIAIG